MNSYLWFQSSVKCWNYSACFCTNFMLWIFRSKISILCSVLLCQELWVYNTSRFLCLNIKYNTNLKNNNNGGNLVKIIFHIFYILLHCCTIIIVQSIIQSLAIFNANVNFACVSLLTYIDVASSVVSSFSTVFCHSHNITGFL